MKEKQPQWFQSSRTSELLVKGMQIDELTRDILGLMGVVILVAAVLISIGTLAGFFRLVETLPIYVLLVFILAAWWGAWHGGWRWASLVPTLLCFLLGAYSSYHTGLVTTLVLFYVIAVLLAGVLQSRWLRWGIVPASIAVHVGLGALRADGLVVDDLPAILTFSFCLTGIAILQWYIHLWLKRALAAALASKQALEQESALRQQAEAVLLEQAALHRRLAENMTDMVVEMDTSGVMKYVSPSHLTELGLAPEALTGTSALNLLHPDDIAMAQEAMQKAAASRAPNQVQVRSRHADGHYVPLEISGRALFENDQLTGFIFSSRDISARRQAEIALLESEWKFRNIIEACPLGIHIYTLREDGQLIFSGYNPAANVILGIDHQEHLGKLITEAFPNLAGSETVLRYTEIARNGGRWKDEQLIYSDNQISGAFEVHAFQTIHKHVAAMFSDITARIQTSNALHQSEEKFSRAFLISPDSININRLTDGVYLDINQGFTRLMGYTCDEVIGKSSLDLNIWANPADRARLVKGLREGGVVENLDANFRRKNGEVGIGLMSASVIEINGEPCILSVTRDITERQLAEQALHTAHDELAQAYDATLQGWVRALEMHERETADHSKRVVELTTQLAGALGISGEELMYIRRGALLHDIGKIGIPVGVLNKPGSFSAEEWAIMHQHPDYAVKLLKDIAYLKEPMDIPYCHHEKWDGTGYPRGLKGEEIPIGARIFAIVDVFDALTSDRPSRPAWTAIDTGRYVLELKGRHF